MSPCQEVKGGTAKIKYRFIEDSVSWAGANASCFGMNAELVIIRDQATQEYLEQTMEEIGWTDGYVDRAWIGLELEVWDNFTWVSGAGVGEESFVSLIHLG